MKSLLRAGVIAATALTFVQPLWAASPRDKDRPAEAHTNALFGEWREIWDPGQPTDVTIHDEYRIRPGAAPGEVEVIIQNRSQLIEKVQLADGVLTFSQHTDSFVVDYRLEQGNDANTLNGTATTPARAYPVRWERMGTAPATPGPGFIGTAAARRPFYGTWACDQTTARYRITSAEGTLVFEAWDRNTNEKFEVTDVRMEGDRLCATFRLPSNGHTTHGRLRASDDNTLIEDCSGGWTGTLTWKRW